MEQIKASQQANSAAAQGQYREEVERDRERAQRQKSKFSKGQIKAVRYSRGDGKSGVCLVGGGLCVCTCT